MVGVAVGVSCSRSKVMAKQQTIIGTTWGLVVLLAALSAMGRVQAVVPAP